MQHRTKPLVYVAVSSLLAFGCGSDQPAGGGGSGGNTVGGTAGTSVSAGGGTSSSGGSGGASTTVTTTSTSGSGSGGDTGSGGGGPTGSAGGSGGTGTAGGGQGGTGGTGAMPDAGHADSGHPGQPMVTIILQTQLTAPHDLAFNPRRPTELWVVNSADDYATIITNATDPESLKAERRLDPSHGHFMHVPSSLAFGADPTNLAAKNPATAPGTFATCGETRGDDDFEGPVLWPSDLGLFAVRAKAGPLGTHIDMLHMSPLCMGIAWQGAGNIYWTFDGVNKSIVQYDFKLDHGMGNDDHSDGEIFRYVKGQLGYEKGVPSHLFYAPESKTLYIADTANSRIVKMDTATATRGARLTTADDLRVQYEMNAMLVDVVPKASGLLQKPSGLELHGGFMFVSDNATSQIHKFGMDGKLVASVKPEVALGSLSGMAFGPDDKLYFVDKRGNKVLRLESGL